MLDQLTHETDLLARHIRVFNAVRANEPVGIHALAEKLDLPRHKVRYSYRVLEKEGVIKPTPTGATLTSDPEEFFEELDAGLANVALRLAKLHSGHTPTRLRNMADESEVSAGRENDTTRTRADGGHTREELLNHERQGPIHLALDSIIARDDDEEIKAWSIESDNRDWRRVGAQSKADALRALADEIEELESNGDD